MTRKIVPIRDHLDGRPHVAAWCVHPSCKRWIKRLRPVWQEGRRRERPVAA